MRILRTAAIAAALAFATAPPAFAQIYLGRETPRAGTIEVGGGGAWGGGFDLPAGDAELSRAVDATGLTLFSVDGKVNGFPGAHARLGIYLSRSISIEGGFRFTKPKLSYELSGDYESAEDEVATETLSQYVFDGSVLFHFTNAAFAGGRGVPFVSAGGGYVRELHEGNELVETGDEIHVTAGIKYWFGGRQRRFGLRGEFGVSSRHGGFDRGDERRTLPIASGGLSVLF
jgi:hypothetical protein